MKTVTKSARQAKESAASAQCPAACPICGGVMIETRVSRRCVRCNWVLCDTCDGETAENEDS